MSLGDKDQWWLLCLFRVAHAHVQNAPLEWLTSKTNLRVMSRLLSENCWLHIRWSTFVAKLNPFIPYAPKKAQPFQLNRFDQKSFVQNSIWKIFDVYDIPIRTQPQFCLQILRMCMGFSNFFENLISPDITFYQGGHWIGKFVIYIDIFFLILIILIRYIDIYPWFL